jgi:hypothetical protein
VVARTAPQLTPPAELSVSPEEVPQPVPARQRTPVDTEAIVRAYFADIPVMIDIAYCESRFTHYLPSGSALRGHIVPTDIGVMQINEYYHGDAARRLGLDLHTLEDNLAYARYLYTRQGTQPWYPSEHCWRRTLAAGS